jgi:hypothetical protein
MTDAVDYINAELATKKIKSLKGEVRALKSIINNAPNGEVVRMGTHMLKYLEQREADERFQEWLKKQAVVLKKKPHLLTLEEIKLARTKFDENERAK